MGSLQPGRGWWDWVWRENHSVEIRYLWLRGEREKRHREPSPGSDQLLPRRLFSFSVYNWKKFSSGTYIFTYEQKTFISPMQDYILVKNLHAMRETWVQSLGWEDPLEEGIVTHSSLLAWRIPMDWGAWWATTHEVVGSDTAEQLSTANWFQLHRHELGQISAHPGP